MLINLASRCARRRNLPASALRALIAFLLTVCVAEAQAPSETHAPARVFFTHYRTTPQGKILDALVTGSEARQLPDQLVLWKDFDLRGIKDGQTNLVQVIAQSPQCTIDYRVGRQRVSDPGPIRIFTPTTNLWVQGVGYFCSETNEVLVISNQVETRVAESLLRSGIFSGEKPGASAKTGQILQINSDRGQFDYRSNLVNYAGHVRAADPQVEMRAPFLSVQFSNTQSVESILAWDGVTITLTNRGIATGATATYFTTNGTELLELAGDAQWRNGQQEARAAKFTYDPDRHFLIADDHVRAHWPNALANPAAPVTLRELWADHATLQMSTNGEAVDAMNAQGDVILVNQADQSRANASQATYDRTNDLFELTGDADWRNDKMEVQGDKLSMASSNQVFHAQGHALLKIQPDRQSTNRWLYIASDDMEQHPLNAQTNLATFHGNVHARVLQDGQMQDTLTSEILLIYLNASNQVETVVARGEVRGETAADAKGVKKTISCGVLTARVSPVTGLLRNVIAEENVVMKLTASGPAAVDDKLTAAIVTAYFSPVTNQVENAVASGDVVFDQNRGGQNVHATGTRAVYDLAPVEQIVLTGHPFAQKDKMQITGAERLTWDVPGGGLNVTGLYHIVSVTNPNPNPPAP